VEGICIYDFTAEVMIGMATMDRITLASKPQTLIQKSCKQPQ